MGKRFRCSLTVTLVALGLSLLFSSPTAQPSEPVTALFAAADHPPPTTATPSDHAEVGDVPSERTVRSTSITVHAASSTTSTTLVTAPIEGFVRRTIFVGDSLLFDAREQPGGRPNDIVKLVEQQIGLSCGGAAPRIENQSRPGLAIKYTMNPNVETQDNTLGVVLHRILSAGLGATDLVIIEVSGIDLNVASHRDISLLGPELISELKQWSTLIDATGAHAIFIPVAGVNDDMYETLRKRLDLDRLPFTLSHRIAVFNTMLINSGLPLLINGFDHLDPDNDSNVNAAFFVDYDVREGGWPDDGIHPNRSGEVAYALDVGEALAQSINPDWCSASIKPEAADAR
jgi:lysophospholipase L1-like esterase